MTYTIEGTWDEIEAQKEALKGHHLRVIVDPEEDHDYGAPEHLKIRDADHLEDLLQEGLASGPDTPVNDEFWAELRQRTETRAATRKDG